MRRLLAALCLLTAALWTAPALAQARSQLGPLCTTETTPADQMINACTKIIALKVFRGRAARDRLFLARRGLEQERRLRQGHRRHDRSDPAPAEPTLGAGTLIAFATAPGRVALDGEGANSPFSAALSRHIGTPGLEVQQMLTRVRAEVVSSTKNKQVPWSNSSLLGEVYLAEK